ncbi:MAG: hypothetical protein K0S41_2623 [Anaerocolumna sp.]|jgi:hypothetical protein|nr:hypothetical protein [Anaerocolumna sp.]
MNNNDIIFLEEVAYQIILCEKDNLIEPDSFGITPIWTNDKNFEYSGSYIIDDLQLVLQDFTITADRSYPTINDIKPKTFLTESGLETANYENIMEPIAFTGGIIVVNTLVKNYGYLNETPSFCYKFVRELLFHDGKLTTTIDHSKAMLRIRKNLELGLRNLDKKRDIRCINRFVKSSFVGDYKYVHDKKKLHKVELNLKKYLSKI